MLAAVLGAAIGAGLLVVALKQRAARRREIRALGIQSSFFANDPRLTGVFVPPRYTVDIAGDRLRVTDSLTAEKVLERELEAAEKVLIHQTVRGIFGCSVSGTWSGRG